MKSLRMRIPLTNEAGSIAPLGIGLFLFSLIFSLTTVSAVSMFIFQKRMTTLAESTAIFVAGGNGEVADFLNLTGMPSFESLQLATTTAADQTTVIANACAAWRAPVVTVGDFAQTKICAQAAARVGD
jgi:hypothetical protein